MKRRKINYKFVYYLIAFLVIFFISSRYSEASGDRDELTAYIKDVSSIMTNADITIRNIGLNYLSMEEGARRMNAYIAQLGAAQCPEDLSRLHKMILLSFKKLRMGLLLFSIERKDASIRLIKGGTGLLRRAAKDILAIVKREGIIKKEPSGEEADK